MEVWKCVGSSGVEGQVRQVDECCMGGLDDGAVQILDSDYVGGGTFVDVMAVDF